MDETTLTPGERDALRLHDAGLGYRRIGVVLGISWSTARDRVKRAKARLAGREVQR